jgi:hypothetical protein
MLDFKKLSRKDAKARRGEDKDNLLLCGFAALRDENNE